MNDDIDWTYILQEIQVSLSIMVKKIIDENDTEVCTLLQILYPTYNLKEQFEFPKNFNRYRY